MKITSKQDFNTLTKKISATISVPHKSTKLKQLIAEELGYNSLNHALADLPIKIDADRFKASICLRVNMTFRADLSIDDLAFIGEKSVKTELTPEEAAFINKIWSKIDKAKVHFEAVGLEDDIHMGFPPGELGLLKAAIEMVLTTLSIPDKLKFHSLDERGHVDKVLLDIWGEVSQNGVNA